MIIRIHELSCDRAGCGIAFQAPLNALYTVRDIRAAAKAEGWTCRKGKDNCPACAAKPRVKITDNRKVTNR